MKKYIVTLEYDVHVNVEIDAENEEEAFSLAAAKAGSYSPEEFVNEADISLNTNYYEAKEQR